jgi:hypothetical protein
VKRRAGLAALVVLALSASLASAATQPLQITGVDTSREPLIAISVRAPVGIAGKGTPAFSVTENGHPISGLSIADPNKGANILAALDVSP